VRALAVVAAGAALLCAAPAQGAAKTVRIYDNYYLKDDLTVARGTTVVWRWPSPDQPGDVHDVKLKSGPNGAKRFHSEAAATGYTYRRKLTVPGRYRIVCTLHTEMRMSITVRRPRA
jgi:plastocyanin